MSDGWSNLIAKPKPGIVGRMAKIDGLDDVYEVVACEYNPGGSFHLLIAASDGSLRQVHSSRVRLVAVPSEGPYR